MPLSKAGTLALNMSAIGTKRTFVIAPHMSALGGKADMAIALRNVLMTQSGHRIKLDRLTKRASSSGEP
jgi:hypothetical protein